MPAEDHRITHVSDTALMVAACRAIETDRADGFVRDPFAARLAGERGMAIAQALPRLPVMCFGIGVRTRFLDELIAECIASRGIVHVLSVGCGLDTRPWRLDLPATLHWTEVDFPDMLEYKAGLMEGVVPHCHRDQVAVDLNDAEQRRALLGRNTKGPGLMITEGLLMYLPASTVEALADEAATGSSVRFWLADITTPAVARAVGMNTFREVQDVQAPDHLDGLQILSTLAERGWTSVARRTYAKDLGFAGERIRAATEALAKAGVPPSPRLPDDEPTGVHLFAR